MRRKLNSIPTNIILLDKHQNIIDVNESAIRSFGFDKNQLVGKSLENLISEDNKEYILELLKKSFNEDLTYEFTTDFIVGEQTVHTLFHIKSEGDHIIACLTPKLPEKEKLIELYWKQSFLKPIIESSKDGLLLIDKELKVRQFNQNACELMIALTQNEKLCEYKEIEEFKITDILDIEEYLDIKQALSKTPDSAQDLFSKTYKRNQQHINLHLRPIWADELGFMGYSLTLKDVSPEIEAVNNLSANTENLIRLTQLAEGSQLTNGILHNTGNALSHLFVSLKEIEKVLDSSNLKQHQLVVEKLKNSSNVETLKNNLPEIFIELEKVYTMEHSEIQIQLKRLFNVCEGIQKIIESQQSFASYSDGLEKITLNEFLEDVFTVESIGLQRHSVRIIKNYDPNAKLMAFGQKSHLFHTLLNLIKNSKDAMNSQPIDHREMTVKLHSDDFYAYIEVSDNGHGISREDLNKVFNYGYTTKSSGHGFGLATCKKYLEEMNGEITVKSDGKNKGATFILKLPLRLQSHQTKKQVA